MRDRLGVFLCGALWRSGGSRAGPPSTGSHAHPNTCASAHGRTNTYSLTPSLMPQLVCADLVILNKSDLLGFVPPQL